MADPIRTRGAGLLALALLAGCARYTARPLDQSDPVARYAGRRLDDPALGAALDSLQATPSPGGWRDWQLATAAWLLRPERRRALAELDAARAAVTAAGARPPAGLNSESEYSFSGSGGEPRIGVALAAAFTIEGGGRRGARIARANAGLVLAAARLAEEARDIRWTVRDALAEWAWARRAARVAEDELALLDSVVVLTRARFEGGAASRSDLARAEADRQEWLAEVAARRREVAQRQAAAAAAIGVPTDELGRNVVRLDSASSCPPRPARDSVARLALASRPELGRVLAEYQVAEAEVRLEAARSWPDLALGPGLFFDHGVSKWTIAFGLPDLLLNGNRGPIREAERRREVAAARVAELQEGILGEVGEAVAGCQASDAEVAALDTAAARLRVTLAEAAFGRGETGRLEVALARLELARARRRGLEAGGRSLRAGLALQRATGVWTDMPTEGNGGGRR